MSDVYRNAVTTPQDELFEPRNSDAADYPTEIAGPGGKATLTENNEKGILEAIVFRTMDPYKLAALTSTHDAHTQGVYGETDGGKYRD